MQLVAELLMKLEWELVVQLMRQLKQWELENVVQLQIDEVATVLRWRQWYVVDWDHEFLAGFVPAHSQRHVMVNAEDWVVVRAAEAVEQLIEMRTGDQMCVVVVSQVVLEAPTFADEPIEVGRAFDESHLNVCVVLRIVQ